MGIDNSTTVGIFENREGRLDEVLNVLAGNDVKYRCLKFG